MLWNIDYLVVELLWNFKLWISDQKCLDWKLISKESEEWCSNVHGDFIFTIFKRDKLKTTLRSSLKYNIHWKSFLMRKNIVSWIKIQVESLIVPYCPLRFIPPMESWFWNWFGVARWMILTFVCLIPVHHHR